jgi:PhnB protein
LIEGSSGPHPAEEAPDEGVASRRPPPTPYRTVTPRIFVPDVDQAVAFLGAVFDATGNVEPGRPTDEEPLDTPYGDRRAMFRDQFGNVYQVAHRR